MKLDKRGQRLNFDSIDVSVSPNVKYSEMKFEYKNVDKNVTVKLTVQR